MLKGTRRNSWRWRTQEGCWPECVESGDWASNCWEERQAEANLAGEGNQLWGELVDSSEPAMHIHSVSALITFIFCCQQVSLALKFYVGYWKWPFYIRCGMHSYTSIFGYVVKRSCILSYCSARHVPLVVTCVRVLFIQESTEDCGHLCVM